jgi:tetratricopeptide (TPR) repeat protein
LAQAYFLNSQICSVAANAELYRVRESRDPDLVLASMRWALTLDPYDRANRLNLAALYLHWRKTPEAEAEYRTVLRYNPEVAVAKLGIVFCRMANHQDEDGIALLQDLIRRLPSWPRPYEVSGRVEIRRKQFHEALRDADRALEIRPDYGQARALRGIALAGLGRYSEAAEEFRKSKEGRYPANIADVLKREASQLKDLPEFAEFFR